MVNIMDVLAPEPSLPDFGSPLDVDGAVLVPGTKGMPSLGYDSQPGGGWCSPELVSLPLHCSAGDSHLLVRKSDSPVYGAVLHFLG